MDIPSSALSAYHISNRKLGPAFVSGLLLVCVALNATVLAQPKTPISAHGIAGQSIQSKANLTPTFWQRDPAADFENQGRMHCAPTAISDGLIYLARAFGMKEIVPGTDHESQIELIKTLAAEFKTDPSIGGTNPDRILTGLQSYVSSKGFRLSRRESMTWRSLSTSNKKFNLGTKPELSWMRDAARSPDTVVVFNFGWYQAEQSGYSRIGGHWVAVVGAELDSTKFYVHNPALISEEQSAKQSVVLTALDEEFPVTKGSAQSDMRGYYRGDGDGLPHGKNITAVLDAVLIFSVRSANVSGLAK